MLCTSSLTPHTLTPLFSTASKLVDLYLGFSFESLTRRRCILTSTIQIYQDEHVVWDEFSPDHSITTCPYNAKSEQKVERAGKKGAGHGLHVA
jgi:hypothetical protein